MRFLQRLFLLTASLFFYTNYLHAQDLRVFGFGQAFYRLTLPGVEQNVTQKLGIAPAATGSSTYNIQQFNLMAASNFGSGFSFFADLEMVSNFDVLKKWGNFSLQEVMARYQTQGGELNVRFGSFLPKFNSFLQVYNRFPLIPYIIRPFAYEPIYYSYFNPEDFFPLKANIQVDGEFAVNDNVTLDYALFHANPEVSLLAVGGTGAGGGGTNSTTIMQYGGRFGATVSSETLGKVTVGGTIVSDKDNQQTANAFGLLPTALTRNIGTIQRTRLGADFRYAVAGFELTGEAISITENLEDWQKKQQDTLNMGAHALGNNPNFPKLKTANLIEDFDKSFYYVTLGYNVMENLFVYGMYTKITDHAVPFIHSGIAGTSFGARYSPVENIGIKAQYLQFTMGEPNNLDLVFKQSQVMFAVSVMF